MGRVTGRKGTHSCEVAVASDGGADVLGAGRRVVHHAAELLNEEREDGAVPPAALRLLDQHLRDLDTK